MSLRLRCYIAYLVIGTIGCGVMYRVMRQRFDRADREAAAIGQVPALPAPASLPAPVVVAPVQPALPAPEVPAPVAVVSAPVPAAPVPQYVVPADTRGLSPMNGWIDQPDRTKPGRMHTNLRVQRSSGAKKRAPASYGGDCWRTVTRPPERLTIPGGTVDVLVPRSVRVSCSQ